MKKKFQLDGRNGKLWGVCAGLANYTGIDVTLIRIAAVVVTILGAFPWTLIAYAATAWIAGPRRWKRSKADSGTLRTSIYEMRTTTRDIDQRIAEIENYVASADGRLAREIEELR